jgi:hypothetical protein
LRRFQGRTRTFARWVLLRSSGNERETPSPDALDLTGPARTITRMPVCSPRIRHLMIALLGVSALGLLFVARASAWRKPTPSERSAIVGVAKRTPHAGNSPIHVSNIRVSTVGPWASANITVYVGSNHVPDGAFEILRKQHGRWVLTKHSPGTAAVSCGIGMPLKDQRNLGVVCTPPG